MLCMYINFFHLPQTRLWHGTTPSLYQIQSTFDNSKFKGGKENSTFIINQKLKKEYVL